VFCIAAELYQSVGSMKKNKETPSHIGLDDALAQIASPLCFALLVKDTSMLPLFFVGDVVIIDPTVRPVSGDFVAAKIQGNDNVLFRKYRLLYMNGSHQFELIALNEDWGKITITSQTEGEILGTLIEHRSKRRIPDPMI
jgi:SOS-response transcriptional repressor LexA